MSSAFKSDVEAGAVDFAPVGPVRIQSEDQMRREAIDGGGMLLGTDLELEVWYHEKDGTTSRLPVINHDYYRTKPDFLAEPTPRWFEQNKYNVKCPVVGCGSPDIKVLMHATSDMGPVADILGFSVQSSVARDQRNAVLAHYQAFHPQTFTDWLAQGVVTEAEARLLRR